MGGTESSDLLGLMVKSEVADVTDARGGRLGVGVGTGVGEVTEKLERAVCIDIIELPPLRSMLWLSPRAGLFVAVRKMDAAGVW